MTEYSEMQVTPEQVRALSMEIAAYQVCFAMTNMLGSRYSDLDMDWMENVVAEEIIDDIHAPLLEIEQNIQTVADMEKRQTWIAMIIGHALNKRCRVSGADIRLSTDAFHEYWVPMIEEEKESA